MALHLTADRVAGGALSWLYALTIAGYPLVSVFPVLGGWSSRVASIPYRALVVSLALVVVALLGIRKGRLRVAATVWLPLALFWALYLFRLTLDTVFAPASLRLSPIEYTLYILGVTLLPMLALLVRPTEAMLNIALRRATLVAGLASTGVLALATQRFLAADVGRFLLTRFETEALNAVSLGHLGVSLIVLTLFRLLVREPVRRPILLLVGVGLGALTVMLSASRGPLLILVLILPLQLILAARSGAPLRATLAAAFLVVSIAGGWRVAQENFDVAAVVRVVTAFDPDDPSTTGRSEVMADAWAQYVEHPIIGAGLEEPRTGFYPHNVVIEAFMATGVVGGFAFLSILLLGVHAIWRVLVHRPQHAWVGLLCIQYVLAAQVSGSLWGSPEMWAFLAAVFALSSAIVAKGSPHYMEPGFSGTRVAA